MGSPVSNTVEPNWLSNWNNAELRDMHRGDSAINKMIAWKEGRQCPNREELLSEAAEVRDYCSGEA